MIFRRARICLGFYPTGIFQANSEAQILNVFAFHGIADGKIVSISLHKRKGVLPDATATPTVTARHEKRLVNVYYRRSSSATV